MDLEVLSEYMGFLWADLLEAKYLGERDFFSKEVPTRGSQFWNSIQKIKWYFKLGARHKVQNGKRGEGHLGLVTRSSLAVVRTPSPQST
jgi:hypothetical protein